MDISRLSKNVGCAAAFRLHQFFIFKKSIEGTLN